MSSGISVIIPSTGNISNLSRLIPSVMSQNTDGVSLQVLVIFNGVADAVFNGIQNVFKSKWPGAEIVRIQDKGVNRARNAGLAKATMPLVLFLDDDCELHDAGIIKRYMELHNANPEYFAIGGGYVLPARHGLFDEVYNYIQMNWFVCGQKSSDGIIVETQYLLGGNFCMKREASVKHRIFFEPGIQYGGSELDFFKSATRAGLKLGATDDMDVTHNTNETFFSVAKKVYKQGRGKHFIDAKFGNDDVVSAAGAGKHLLLRRLYSYWFWAGYYDAEGNSWKLLKHMARDFFGYLNVLRFNIIKKL